VDTTQPKPAGPWWKRQIEGVFSHIDDNAQVPPGPVLPETRCATVYIVSALCLCLLSYFVLSRALQASTRAVILEWLEHFAPALRADLVPYERLVEHSVWAVGCFVCYFVIPALVVRGVFRHRLADYGLTSQGLRQHLWVYVAMFAPVGVMVLLLADDPSFQHQYPFYRQPRGVSDFMIWECFYALQFFSLEFFFRGFMLHGVKDRLGRYAIFAMVIPYMMIHFQKPLLETLGAVIAGTILGVLSLRTGSIWGGVMIHVAVALSMDIAAYSIRAPTP
jgi:membrane protease YdiL (CAAX protease family)